MNIREVRKKLKSVGNVKKITNAMEMVSVIKMKKAQQKATESKPYEDNLDRVIKEMTVKIDPSFSKLLRTPSENVTHSLSIVITSDKGLCGAYNMNLLRFLAKNCHFEENDFIVIGKKGALFLNKMGAKIVADFSSGSPVNNVSAIFRLVLDGYLNDKYRAVNIFFNRFVSTLKNEPIKLELLPITYQPETEVDKKVKIKEYLIEPDPKQVIDQLLNSYIEERIRNSIIQAEAGEHSSRMIAMKNATDNAEQVIYNLTLLRNKIRQEKITYELLDMMTAKESVEE